MMSGTSLDGVDIAWCEFFTTPGQTTFKIIDAETIPYPVAWKKNLEAASSLSGLALSKLDREYGTYLANLARSFMQRTGCKPDFIASHGHTIFHQPEQGITLQIGHGSLLASTTRQTVISDFRSLDVALGGQGAPLVPAGDKHLFGHFDFCLNLGGFANISYDINKIRIAYDICPANIALNFFTRKSGFDFDEDGKMAAHGCLNNQLLNTLNDLDFYHKTHPKSLGREWLENNFLPLIDNNIPVSDILHTLTEHIAIQIANATADFPAGKILTTGGGAENGYLMTRIRNYTQHELVIPDIKLVRFKEALVFAYLGFLRLQNQINTFASVTGAKYNSSGGSIFRG